LQVTGSQEPLTIIKQAGCLMYGFLIRSGTHLERILNRSCPLLLPEIIWFVVAIRNFRLRRSSLEWKSNITLDKGQKLIVCAKKEKCSLRLGRCTVNHPGHPENRDPDEIRLSAGRRGKAKKSPGAKTLRSFFRRISIFTIAGQLHQSLLVDEAGPSPAVAHCRPGDLVLEGYSFAL
jgi:hypothetical protein